MKNNFNESLIQYEKELFIHCRYLTRDSYKAEDLKQDVFLRAIRYQDQFDGRNLKSWLFTIAYNTFINECRRIKKIQENTEKIVPNIHELCPMPDDGINVNEILQLVDKLPERFKKAIRMRLDGYTYEEIAVELNVEIGTVKSRIHFGRKILLKFDLYS